MLVNNPGVVFPHQAKVFQSLLLTANAFRRENWWALPVLPRWHTLVVAPTGTGKSHIIHSLGKALDWPVFSIYVSRWIVAGGRGKETWQELAGWLAKQQGKCLIFLDEIDKIYGDDTWSRHLRTEVFQILDRDLPAAIEIDDEYSEHSKEALWAKGKMNLQCNTMIIAAGAFQFLWDTRPKTLGFGSAETENRIPSAAELQTVLPAELVNRFLKILALPPLTKDDYLGMIKQTCQALPGEIRTRFSEIAEKNLSTAIIEGKGARYVEECITAALLIDSELKLYSDRLHPRLEQFRFR